MLSDIIPYLNIQLDALGYFSALYELCEQTDIDGKKTVQQYCGNGSFKSVSMFSFNQGTSYFRKTGSIGIAESQTETMVACDNLLTVSIPLRWVGVIPKNRLSQDDVYAADRLGNTVLKALAGNGNSLKTLLKARRITFVVSAINDAVYKDEFSGRDMPFEYICVGIDFTIEVLINQSCLVEECDY